MPDPIKPEIIQKIEALLDRYAFKPRAKKPPVLSKQGLPYATFHRRMSAATIDAFIIMLLITPFNHLIMAYVYSGWPPEPTSADAARVLGSLFQIQYTILAVFSFGFWHWKGATPGKLVLGMRIVDAKTGAKIDDMQSAIRVLAYLVSGLPLLLGFFAVGISRKKQGWHDMLAGTVVVVDIKSAPRAADPSDSPAPKAEE